MADGIANLVEGMPVEIGKIDRELKRLWQEGEGAATRASLINFAIYCEGAELMRDSTKIFSEITRDHACRAILIGVEPTLPGSSVQACITAHCHTRSAGAKQVCCEQISFLLGNDSQALIPNIVFSHLDSDLPLYLWWRGELPAESEEQLWTWVDRLIFDSQTWKDAGAQFQLLRTSIEPAAPRMTLCDLNWTRSLYVRQAIAQIFDHPEYLAELPGLDQIEIAHGPGMRTTGLLLAGWLGGQLNWKLGDVAGEKLSFREPGGNTVTVALREEAGRAIGSVRLAAGGDTSFVLEHHEGSGFLYADIKLTGNRESHLLMPGGKDDQVALLDDELMSGGKHKVYLKAASMMAGAF